MVVLFDRFCQIIMGVRAPLCPRIYATYGKWEHDQYTSLVERNVLTGTAKIGQGRRNTTPSHFVWRPEWKLMKLDTMPNDTF